MPSSLVSESRCWRGRNEKKSGKIGLILVVKGKLSGPTDNVSPRKGRERWQDVASGQRCRLGIQTCAPPSAPFLIQISLISQHTHQSHGGKVRSCPSFRLPRPTPLLRRQCFATKTWRGIVQKVGGYRPTEWCEVLQRPFALQTAGRGPLKDTGSWKTQIRPMPTMCDPY